MATDNREQVEYWNGQAGATWVAAQERLDAMLAPISAAAIEAAAPQPGERAVDVGCGCGDTSLALAERGAAVWGIDISEPMLERARARARGVSGVAFSRTDASTQSFTPDHDLVFSRFGVMFFDAPVAAFGNLRTALGDSGRLSFVCWQAPGQNPWVAIAGQAAQPYLPEPDERPDPRAPGPFAFADPDYVRDVLTRAGFVDVAIEPLRTTVHVADDLDEAMRFMGQVGPLSRVLAELGDEPRERALGAVREALAGQLTEGGLDLGASCWLVGARGG